MSGPPLPEGPSPPAPAGDPGPPAAGPPPAGGRTAREPPPPLEANDQLVTGIITAGWAIALVVLLAVHGGMPPREQWWIWTAVAGFTFGLFGLLYVPHLKRSRDRAAQRRARRPSGPAGTGQP